MEGRQRGVGGAILSAMRHSRDEVIERTVREFELLDEMIAGLSDEEWRRPLPRSETKEPWTVKDGIVHIVHWKADMARSARRQKRPPELRGLSVNDHNRVVYERWRDRSPEEVRAWHREVQEDVLAALREAPDEWFSGRERNEEWPYDFVGHSTDHRVKDIGRVLAR